MSDPTGPDVAARLEALEGRLRELEDEREILRLITGYGPLVDGGAADDVAALWTDDGIYDVDEVYLDGSAAIRQMVESSAHQGWISGGCAHFLGPARVTLDGNDAVAVCHSLMVVNTDEGFRVRRATAHHWQLRRTPAGWRTTVRTSRVLDGRPESPALLRAGARGERA
ncbi:nuclear transport factor 2 family protein [Nocardioides sp. YIM 152315]|uniref:nuclear transport factor 2 family protein n=1 Tax=Nocardioides sp. YIM 152315 TaxID=3031760 RepID=UPI0023DAF25D|nr:nuclear transport factor 2 family protein [Nocardioides sp. YIM 152315]MDF1604102.1 nuclear transport factor 2 family protein [Nocardioides sp. YIM 152315]